MPASSQSKFGTTDRQREYREIYLRSDHWSRVREGALERAEHRCSVCNSGQSLDVHHRTYERLGDERPSDLLVLCRGCHDIFHRSGRLARSNSDPRPSTAPRAGHSAKTRHYKRSYVPRTTSQTNYRAMVLAAMTESPSSTADIARRAGMTRNQAGKTLRKLANSGEVIYQGKRWIKSTASPRQLLASKKRRADLVARWIEENAATQIHEKTQASATRRSDRTLPH